MKIEINGDGFELDDAIKSYVEKKLKKLTKKMNKHQKESAHAVVVLKQRQADPSQKFQAEIILRLPPKEELVAKESTLNMFAAIDIAGSKIDSQLMKYKSKHARNKVDRKGTLARLRSLADRDFRGKQN